MKIVSHFNPGGIGFALLVRFFIKLDAKYAENVDVNDLLSDGARASCNVQKLATDCKSKLKEELYEVVSSSCTTSTIDIWTSNYVERNFIIITWQYRKELSLVDIVL